MDKQGGSYTKATPTRAKEVKPGHRAPPSGVLPQPQAAMTKHGAGSSYQTGGVVEPEGGQVEADEFVVPADVAKFLGHKFLQDLVSKAQAEMGGGDAAMNPVGALAEETPGSPA